jgi:hypothetical protein
LWKEQANARDKEKHSQERLPFWPGCLSLANSSLTIQKGKSVKVVVVHLILCGDVKNTLVNLDSLFKNGGNSRISEMHENAVLKEWKVRYSPFLFTRPF